MTPDLDLDAYHEPAPGLGTDALFQFLDKAVNSVPLPAAPVSLPPSVPEAQHREVGELERAMALPGWWRRLSTAQMLDAGALEGPDECMRFDLFRRYHPGPTGLEPTLRREYNRLSRASARARDEAPTGLMALYAYKNARFLASGVRVTEFLDTRDFETDAEREQRLRPLLLAGLDIPMPIRETAGQKGPVAAAERLRYNRDKACLMKMRRDRVRLAGEAARRTAAELKRWEKQKARLPAGHPAAQAARGTVIALRAEAERAKSWSQQAMDDLFVIQSRGLALPLASRHLDQRTPLPLRTARFPVEI